MINSTMWQVLISSTAALRLARWRDNCSSVTITTRREWRASSWNWSRRWMRSWSWVGSGSSISTSCSGCSSSSGSVRRMWIGWRISRLWRVARTLARTWSMPSRCWASSVSLWAIWRRMATVCRRLTRWRSSCVRMGMSFCSCLFVV